MLAQIDTGDEAVSLTEFTDWFFQAEPPVRHSEPMEPEPMELEPMEPEPRLQPTAARRTASDRWQGVAKSVAPATTFLDKKKAAESHAGLSESKMVDRIFEMLDTDHSGILNFAEIRLLAEHTGGVAMTKEEYLQVAQAVGFDPAVGIYPEGLRRIYLELEMGDARSDYKVMANMNLEAMRLGAKEVAAKISFGARYQDILGQDSGVNGAPQEESLMAGMEIVGDVERGKRGAFVRSETLTTALLGETTVNPITQAGGPIWLDMELSPMSARLKKSAKSAKKQRTMANRSRIAPVVPPAGANTKLSNDVADAGGVVVAHVAKLLSIDGAQQALRDAISTRQGLTLEDVRCELEELTNVLAVDRAMEELGPLVDALYMSEVPPWRHDRDMLPKEMESVADIGIVSPFTNWPLQPAKKGKKDTPNLLSVAGHLKGCLRISRAGGEEGVGAWLTDHQLNGLSVALTDDMCHRITHHKPATVRVYVLSARGFVAMDKGS